MRCEEIEPKFDRYLEGDLRAVEHLCVEVHLTQCYLCRESLNEYRAMNRNVSELLRHPSPEDEFDALWRRIQFEALAAAELPRDSFRMRRGSPRYAVAAGLVVVAACSGTWLHQRIESTDARKNGVELQHIQGLPPVIESLDRRTRAIESSVDSGTADEAISNRYRDPLVPERRGANASL